MTKKKKIPAGLSEKNGQEKSNLPANRVEEREIISELKECYLDYAMSVIVARALPDVRDGMKPVQRRILWAMWDMGLSSSAKFIKSARIVGECFVKDTLITTTKGLLPIQEVEIGDEVYTQTGIQKIIRRYEMPPKKLLKITLENGSKNIATQSQKFKVLNQDLSFKWKEAKDLNNNDYLILRGVYPEIKNLVGLGTYENTKIYLNENLAYLLGLFTSDGWITNDYSKKKYSRIGFVVEDRKVLEKIKNILKKEFSYTPSIEIKKPKILSVKSGKLSKEIHILRINRKSINDFLAQTFDLENKWALTKEIPKQIFRSPKSVVFSFISGLIEGDGSISKSRNCIQYGSISEKLTDQLAALLLSQGIFSAKYKNKIDSKNKKECFVFSRKIIKRHQSYSLEIIGENAIKLASKIILFDEIKNNKLQRLQLKKFANYDRKGPNKFDIIPYAGEVLFQELSRAHLGGGWYEDKNQDKFRMGIKYPCGSKIRYSADLQEKPLRRTQVAEWGIKEKLEKINSPFFDFLEQVTENNLYFAQIKSVESIIPEKTYDLEVENEHEFIANGAISHNCLGKYHPHGDSSVYEAMVRMAQDFSLRYPLVKGQGNFGCFTKDTKVKLVDGRSLSFEDLIKEYKEGKKNYTYTVNSAGLISVAEIKNPRLTRKNTEIMKVILDNGEEIKCTLNHLFMTKSGVYKEAKDLKPGESLMPLYEKLSEKTDRLNREGYILIYQNKIDEWIPAHHLADNYNLTAKKYSKRDGRVRHHLDFNKLNNSPDNMQRIDWGKHWRIHYEQAANLHKNKEYREKIAEGRKEFWSNPVNRAKYAKRISEQNFKNWQNPEYREKMSKFLSVANKKYIQSHPEKRIEISKRATQTLKRLWQDPVYKKLFHEKIVSANKKRITNNTGKVKFLKICREVLKEYKILNQNLYEQKRCIVYDYGSATSWQTGMQKYYDNNKEILLNALNRNHKVIKIEFLKQKEDVYDLTIEKSHNFALAAGVFVHNSIDGDGAAAQRYTEAKISKIAEELLTDIDKGTVDWVPNYDETRMEPKVLPAKVPNLLLNGTVGIAVGMATNIPPHNLTEIVDATKELIDKPKTTSEELMEIIKGPDFPTGGIIYDKKAIKQAYATGRGAITTRGKAEVLVQRKSASPGQRESASLVITEIPYQVNKSELIIKIAELVTEKRIQGIKDVRDESDKDGLSIVIDLKNDGSPQKVLNQLYKFTDLQKNFNLNMVALMNGIQPQTLSIKEIIGAYIEHRKEVVRRRAEYDLKKAEERAHILMGLHKALGEIDKVIAVIKKSADKDEAHKNLVTKFKFSDIQAGAILEMRLQALASLERQKIEDELKEKKKLIEELNLLLKSPKEIMDLIKSELSEMKEKYGDERKTKVVSSGLEEFSEEDLVPKEETIITMSKSGYIKRVNPSSFRSQKRGGKGLIGSEVAEEDFLSQFIFGNTHDNILFFTEKGRVFQTKVYEIPEASRVAKGRSIHNFLEIPAEERIATVISYADALTNADKTPTNVERSQRKSASSLRESAFLVMATQNGIIKKTALADFANVRRNGIIAISLKKGDMLQWVKLSTGKDQIVLSTSLGQAIRFKESQIRAMGRTASGVKGIRLKKDDKVVSLDIVSEKASPDTNILTVMSNGFGKQTKISQYKVQGRGGSGIKTAKVVSKNGKVVASLLVGNEQELLALSAKGQIIRMELSSIRVAGRATQGVRIMNLNSGDKIVGVICF